ncbi:AmmeMemoRadiSam system protein B [Candidatus Falkowbacteria bacterium RIFOXYB2_FULL_34_18]|uniref:AmmeMemoRadiSam system protein B n=1 Tax=Candidatus Falkowbacteria bacterium RIFOXYD2_FULL_34_120 TaxID=1798007 RepID=A0A1F5TQK5_9BACT|nr:MAG: AmmeMemoRadiSam system protein B [Candidatus Falkowbacteria bacterium RIFOXYB2_FULL_34_18]OGF29481.1 MAG: AmmeMemoRadiSam system protein B [Candidatus Falkowbacteria bacterium RIFOXYC12_FULL_34_55]OGF36298.1 MAG: AmmeMemoRadiSam system protein B [Candidatus Falkowbacteria bacterium RIFOXYC2_FULL_34_220]OGF39007.1 MAG: AmmeMemoRadiSam system protein B [Candidatus Falkowbacteria bacterium RIFOXYD12_FULL_34_57]OGF41226.1 MAG: AmmeMemoRadiSam system protein B [Candidatus Falkowbacteria bact
MQSLKIYIVIIFILSLCIAGLIILPISNSLEQGFVVMTQIRHISNPNNKDFFETAGKFNKKEFDLSGKRVVAGIIPHHLLAADLISEFFYNLDGQDYDTIILIGPNHYNQGNAKIITSEYDWETPYGILKNDRNILDILKNYEDIEINENVIGNEHAIYGEVSFIKKYFPKAKMVPLILRSNINKAEGDELVKILMEAVKDKNFLMLASADFSHYKDSLTAQKNDQDSIQAIRSFDFENIYDLDIDSPPAIYTILKFCELQNAAFKLLHNSNSALLTNRPELDSTTSYVTGYFTQESDKIKMLFLGDLMLDRYVLTKIKDNNLSFLFDDLNESNFFDSYDLISANLEGPVTDKAAYYPPIKEFDFAFDPSLVIGLKKYNFNFLNLANNHFDDQGARGIIETRKNLDRLGFYYSGCINGIIDDCSSTIIQLGNKGIAMVGLSLLGEKLENKFEGLIKELKEKSDIIVVNIHWGNEYDQRFNSIQQKLAHELIDAGADLIIGHHPHVVQGVEIYKNRAIFYSLGNFIFDQYFNEETQKGLAIKAVWQDNDFNFELLPFKSQNSRISLVLDKEKEEMLKRIIDNSEINKFFFKQIENGYLQINNK